MVPYLTFCKHKLLQNKWPHSVSDVLLHQVPCAYISTHCTESCMACLYIIPKGSGWPPYAEARPYRVLDNPSHILRCT
jgi:hypothetical protein